MAAVGRKDCRKRLSPKTFTGLFKFGSTEARAYKSHGAAHIFLMNSEETIVTSSKGIIEKMFLSKNQDKIFHNF